MAIIIKSRPLTIVGGLVAGMIKLFLMVAVLVPIMPVAAQSPDYVIYYASVRERGTKVDYCGIARAEERFPGRKIDERKSRRHLCERLVKRLRMGIQYPSSGGSCPGYSKRTAQQCLEDGVDLEKLVFGAR